MYFIFYFFSILFILNKVQLSEIYKDNNIIVSLTSFPPRIKTVHLTIQSILNQNMKPYKVILWLATTQFPEGNKSLPQNLLNLTNKGLSIEYYNQDIKSYKKLIPALKKYPNNLIVTADDDLIYNKNWLQKLYNSYLKYPKDISVHRVTKFFYKKKKFHIITGGKKYYKTPSFLNKLTSGSGALFFPGCFYKDILDDDKFMSLAPTNDDIWFWLQAVLNGVKIRVVENPIIKLNYIPKSQKVALYKINDQGKKLFWKDFYRILNFYSNLKTILINEYQEMIIPKIEEL